MSKTAVIYARYSCEKQTEQSIEGQLRVCNEFAERNGLLIVQAHPFRGECLPASPENIDGVEVWNGHPGWFSPEQPLKAEAFADKFGLIKTAGSDFHGGSCVAGTGLLFPEEIKDWKTALCLLKSGRFSPVKSRVFE